MIAYCIEAEKKVEKLRAAADRAKAGIPEPAPPKKKKKKAAKEPAHGAAGEEAHSEL